MRRRSDLRRPMTAIELFQGRAVDEGTGELVDEPRAKCARLAAEIRAALIAGVGTPGGMPRDEFDALEHALDGAIAEIEKDAPILNRRDRRAHEAKRRRGVQ